MYFRYCSLPLGVAPKDADTIIEVLKKELGLIGDGGNSGQKTKLVSIAAEDAGFTGYQRRVHEYFEEVNYEILL